MFVVEVRNCTQAVVISFGSGSNLVISAEQTDENKPANTPQTSGIR